MRNERGAITVITAIFISSILAGMALVADVGLVYQEKRQLQTGVDAASLAGTQDLAEGKSQTAVESTARQYLRNNANVTPDQINFSYPDDSSFRVTTKTSRGTFFARMFGVKSASVSASATARTAPAGSVGDLVPIIIPENGISGHIGPANRVSFEMGSDRPLEPFSVWHVKTGNMATYTITYINTANKTINLQIWDQVPTNTTYINGSATSGGTFDGTTVRWAFNDVAAGDSRVVTFKLDVSAARSCPTNTTYAQASPGGQVETAQITTPQSGFFWLTDFNGVSGGVPDYRNWIINGYPEEVSIGDLVNGEGMKATLRDALAIRLANKPDMILPVYNYTEGGGSPGTYHVVGFVQFIMTGFNLNGNPKTITGYFTNGTVASGSGDPTARDYGVKAIWLSE